MGIITKLIIGSIALVAALNVNAETQQVKSTRIVGGVEAAVGEFPYIVSLRSTFMGHFCGGSLIRPGWVLTAAHCVSSAKFKVVTGLNTSADALTSESFDVKKVIKHPSYNKPISSSYDFALVQLDGVSRGGVPVGLNIDELDIATDEAVALTSVTAGWGAMSEGGGVSKQLMKVEVPLVNMKNCELAYPKKMHESMICAGFVAGGKDSCQGDSGGPLVFMNAAGETVLGGVVSWGQGCARPNKFGVYGKVNAINAWIEETILANSPEAAETEHPEENPEVDTENNGSGI